MTRAIRKGLRPGAGGAATSSPSLCFPTSRVLEAGAPSGWGWAGSSDLIRPRNPVPGRWQGFRNSSSNSSDRPPRLRDGKLAVLFRKQQQLEWKRTSAHPRGAQTRNRVVALGEPHPQQLLLAKEGAEPDLEVLSRAFWVWASRRTQGHSPLRSVGLRLPCPPLPGLPSLYQPHHALLSALPVGPAVTAAPSGPRAGWRMLEEGGFGTWESPVAPVPLTFLAPLSSLPRKREEAEDARPPSPPPSPPPPPASRSGSGFLYSEAPPPSATLTAERAPGPTLSLEALQERLEALKALQGQYLRGQLRIRRTCRDFPRALRALSLQICRSRRRLIRAEVRLQRREKEGAFQGCPSPPPSELLGLASPRQGLSAAATLSSCSLLLFPAPHAPPAPPPLPPQLPDLHEALETFLERQARHLHERECGGWGSPSWGKPAGGWRGPRGRAGGLPAPRPRKRSGARERTPRARPRLCAPAPEALGQASRAPGAALREGRDAGRRSPEGCLLLPRSRSSGQRDYRSCQECLRSIKALRGQLRRVRSRLWRVEAELGIQVPPRELCADDQEEKEEEDDDDDDGPPWMPPALPVAWREEARGPSAPPAAAQSAPPADPATELSACPQ
ncbi:caskin-1-like [Candoia aspera]|uniref:caskin-1-like n=1 Tax=Candoia aspera TaxID=51853 RepID=UPI002FD7ECBE